MKYRGPIKKSRNPTMVCREGNLWKFVNKYRSLDYALILHDNLIVEREYQEYAKYHPNFKITKEWKHAHIQDKNVRLSYVSRKPIPTEMEHKLLSHLTSWYDKSYAEYEYWPHACFDNPSGKAIETRCRYFPPLYYDAIHIELFRPDRMDRQKAASYVLDLATLLSSLEKSSRNKL